MKLNLGLVLYYTKANRYSFNALVGAIEAREQFDTLKIYFFEGESQLLSGLHSVLDAHEKVVVGFSICTPQLWEISRTVKLLPAEYRDRLVLVAGGPHPTGDPLGVLRIGFDVVVRGEGEETLLELLERIGRNEDWRAVKGIAFLDGTGRCMFTGQRAWVDLDNYPPFAVKHSRVGHIEITRGCPFGCGFCQTPHIFGGRPRHRSVHAITKYVRILKEKGLTDIRFITPNAFGYGSPDGRRLALAKLEELLQGVREVIGIHGRLFFGTFPSEVRPEHVSPETVALVLRYADNDNLIIGAQSGSQRLLDLCRRGHRVEDVYRAVELTLEAGLEANVDFIFGLPGETEDDVVLTVELMKNLVRMGARIHAHTFMPLPQSCFSEAPAGRVGKELRKIISELASHGLAYGEWEEQERLGDKIAAYFRTGRLDV
ncbi:MAG: TIGR04013 family B12-binding domain/radical SAM domain-containing protein [Verrucomicrobiae bacterium]|nr:TIGR04013 family B12-binding domain/radical SAM domain-containing protein [Verrucomicrobiae bacterium]